LAVSIFCPKCLYELTGLSGQGGMFLCPECGGRVEGVPERSAGQDRLHRRLIRFERAVVLPVLGAAFILGTIVASKGRLAPPVLQADCVPIFMVWASTLMGFAILRRELLRAAAPWGVLFMLPAVAASMWAMHDFRREAALPWIHAELISVAILILACVQSRERTAVSILLLSTIVFLTPGVMMMLTERSGPPGRAEFWSIWPDLRDWQPAAQYPLTSSEARLGGRILTLVGTCLLVATIVAMYPRAPHAPGPMRTTPERRRAIKHAFTAARLKLRRTDEER